MLVTAMDILSYKRLSNASQQDLIMCGKASSLIGCNYWQMVAFRPLRAAVPACVVSLHRSKIWYHQQPVRAT